MEIDNLEEWQVEMMKQQLMEREDVPEHETMQVTKKPQSKIQALIADTFNRLKNCTNPDVFDGFYHNSELAEYGQKYRYAEFVQDLLDRLNITEEFSKEELKTEDVERALFTVAERVYEERESLTSIADEINQRYENLVTVEDIHGDDPEKYRNQMHKYIEREIERMDEVVEDRDQFKEFFNKMEAYQEHDLDTAARELNTIVDIGHDIWKVLLCSSLSSRATPFNMGGRPTRPVLHTLLIGDISTAKSKILGIIDEIAPQALNVTKMTEASFIGQFNSKKGEIEKGVIDKVLHGNLIIEEYDKIEKDDNIMRNVFDNGNIHIEKGGDVKHFDRTPVSVMAGANPKKDFFTTKEDNKLRDQIPFKEGELSRFDVLIPLVNTKEQMNKYAEGMSLFGRCKTNDLSEISDMMDALATKIQQVDTVAISEPHEQQIVQSFKQLQQDLQKGSHKNEYRPTLLIMRDLEILARLVNIVACVYGKPEKGEVVVNEDIISEAVSMFEELITMRKKLYTKNDRDTIASTTKEQVYRVVCDLSEQNGGTCKRNEVKDKCISSTSVDLNNKVSIYKKIDTLMQEKRVAQVDDKERYTEITPVS